MTEIALSELPPDEPFHIPDDPTQATPNQRASMAFELRKAGVPYDQIATKLGYQSPRSAESAVARVLEGKYTSQDVEKVVAMELARLDALQAVAWRRAKEGDLRAIDRILKIMERRAQYLGLDRQEGGGGGDINQTAIFIGGSQTDYIEQLRQVREQMQRAIETQQV